MLVGIVGLLILLTTGRGEIQALTELHSNPNLFAKAKTIVQIKKKKKLKSSKPDNVKDT
jgi:hypothetical protein